MRKRRRARERRVELASAEAAADDAAFAADEVRGEAAALLNLIVKAWTARDRVALRPDARPRPDGRVGPPPRRLRPQGLAQRLRDRRGARRRSTSASSTAPTTPTTASRSASGRASATSCATRTATRSSATTSASEIVDLAEYWTLGKRDGRWVLLSIEQDAEGAHHLDADIVASPWGDEGRLRDEAVTELATADAVPDAAIAEHRRPRLRRHRPRRRARPRDGRRPLRARRARGRRAPRGRRLGGGGRRRRRRARARRHARARCASCSTPGDASGRTRLVVRGPRLRALRITALHADAAPPAMLVEADVSGRRYREDRDTAAVVEGSKEREATFTERWTMTLDGDAKTPWRIAHGAAVSSPLADVAVPNVSEGRDRATLDAIGAAFEPAARGCWTATRTPTTTARCSRSPASRARSRRRPAGRPRGDRPDRPDRPRGRAPARRGDRRRADRLPRRRRPRRGVRRGAGARRRARARAGLPVYLYGALAGGRTRAELRRGGPEALIARRLRPTSARPRLHPTAGAVLVAARAAARRLQRRARAAGDARGRARDRRADPRGRGGGAARRAGDRRAAGAQGAARSPPTSRTTARATPADVVAAVAPPRAGGRPPSSSRSRPRRRSRASPRTCRCAAAQRSRSGSSLGSTMAQTKRKRRSKHRGNAAGNGGGARAHEPAGEPVAGRAEEGRPASPRARRG